MRSSKEDQEESVLAPLTEIKRLRQALPSRIMEYGISQPAQDSRNENSREICGQPCSRIIHSPTCVPLFSSPHYILETKVTFFPFCLPNSVISFHFASPLNSSLSLKSLFFFHFSLSKVNSESKSHCAYMQMSPHWNVGR